MDKKAQIFRYFFILVMILMVLGIVGVMSPQLNILYSQGSSNAGLSGVEKLVIENFVLILFIFGGAAVFLMSTMGGGE